MPRAVRSDARRNAERLREAAMAVFMERGIDAPLEQVARAAGVSIGTLYNHFPQREQLLDAVLPEAATTQLARIQAAVDTADTPGTRLERYLREVFAIQSTDRLLSDALATAVTLPAVAAAACNEVMTLGIQLLVQARDENDHLLLDEDGLRALILANSIVQRATPPAGWDALLHSLARAER